MRSILFAAIVALSAAPALAAPPAATSTTPAAATPPAGTAKTRANPLTGGKKKACDAAWKTMSDADKAKYKDQAKGMKSKKGNQLNGYNVYTSQCTKK